MDHAVFADQPELVFGLVGPIGVDMEAVFDELETALRGVGYQSHLIHLTKEISAAFPRIYGDRADNLTFQDKISLANEINETSGRKDIFALLAIAKIIEKRAALNATTDTIDENARGYIPVERTAFIVRQLKRTKELETLRKTYGKRFVQISVTISAKQQEKSVEAILTKENPTLHQDELQRKVREIIATDQEERGKKFGQQLSKSFQTGDVFIDGTDDETIRTDCSRFINALFGMNSISPTIDEFGSYLAKVASLRSIDLSRQVGSAIMSTEGDIIAIGCNEVPRPGGGNYWCNHDAPKRDMDIKVEANKLETSRIIHNFVEIIHEHGSLKVDPESLLNDSDFKTRLKASMISDITEFGRMTHAEMAALTDAARLGRPLYDSTIYVTTYPCHNCAKHLIAAGITRIVYIEPYPKSRALALHDDALTLAKDEKSKVLIEHFRGISPRRFRDIFEKGARKDANNNVRKWFEGVPKPLVGDRFSTHVFLEHGPVNDFMAVRSQLEKSEIKECDESKHKTD